MRFNISCLRIWGFDRGCSVSARRKFWQAYGLLAVMLLIPTCGFSFALLGPLGGSDTSRPDGWQQPVIAYQVGDDIGTPKNLGEEYRWNTPVLYYAFDQTFLDYFGSNGVFAIEQAIAVLNGLTNVSSYSQDLSEFPLEAQRVNFRAQALSLTDLKTIALALFAEQLGLADPVRWVWGLHGREVIGPRGCPIDMSYSVVMRNFDPVFSTLDQLQPSAYVNGVRYTYLIIDACTGTPTADALEFSVDPLAFQFSPIASFHYNYDYGLFYTGMTRDDVGGLRYLLRTNNMNFERAGSGTLTVVTNQGPGQLLYTSNLAQLVSTALTNNAAALQALYPDLIITTSIPIFTNVVTTNIFAYFTNSPWSAPGDPATPVTVTVRSTNVATWFEHIVQNVKIGPFYTNGPINLYSNRWPYTNGVVVVQTTRIGQGACDPWAVPGTICTNVTTQTVTTRAINGDFFIVPTNACDVAILRTQLTTLATITNQITTATNTPGTTNSITEQMSMTYVAYWTNNVFVVNLVSCLTNSIALRQGIERIRFVRRDFDSLIGNNFTPTNSTYTLIAITNNALVRQPIIREVLRPDIVFTADDLAAGPDDSGTSIASRSIRFVTNNLPGLAGPGTIEPDVRFSFNKVGPIFNNLGFNFLRPQIPDEFSHVPMLIWGSFDGTTNAPVVYPNGTSITNLENQVLMPLDAIITYNNLVSVRTNTTLLPDGKVDLNYPLLANGGSLYPIQVAFAGSGGQPPYEFGLEGAPTGMTLSVTNGIAANQPVVLNWTPDTDGIFDIVVRMTDAGARFVDRHYTITINP